jgi:hypothetical protein
LAEKSTEGVRVWVERVEGRPKETKTGEWHSEGTMAVYATAIRERVCERDREDYETELQTRPRERERERVCVCDKKSV